MGTREGTPAIQPQDKAILSECRDILRRILPGATVYLYGSGVRGAREPDSDLDLLILTEHRLSREEEDRAAHAVYDIELTRGVVISTLFYSREEWDAPLSPSACPRSRRGVLAVSMAAGCAFTHSRRRVSELGQKGAKG
jgi:predicted nucleotidyltransferase